VTASFFLPVTNPGLLLLAILALGLALEAKMWKRIPMRESAPAAAQG